MSVRAPAPAPVVPPRLLADRLRPTVLARDELLPVTPVFTELLGTPGLRRGSTVAISTTGPPGVTALACSLLAAASSEGAWCAAVSMGDLGVVAAAELGVALDRLALVPHPGSKLAPVIAALLDGCDAVLAPADASASQFRRLAARARERRSVLVLLSGSRAVASFPRPVPEGVDVRIVVEGNVFRGLGLGTGRLGYRHVDVVVTRRSATPRTVRASLGLDAGAIPVLEAVGAPLDSSAATEQVAVR
jgi:hypothetical protein